MQVNSTNSILFGKLHLSRYIGYTSQQLQLLDKIENELQKPYPKNKKGNSYLEVFERKGYDVYINHGSKDGTVDIYVSSKNEETGMPDLNEDTFAGHYEKPEQFDINQLERIFKKRSQEDKSLRYGYLAFISAVFLLAATMLGNAIYFEKNVRPKRNQITFVKDTLSKDSIKVAKDSLQLKK